MNKHFSIVEGLNSFINSSLHKTFFLLISLSLTTSLWSADYIFSSFTSDNDVTLTVSASNPTVQIILHKRTGSTNPTWNASKSEARLYAKGSLEITSSVDIVSVSFDYVINANNSGKIPTIDGVSGGTNAGTWTVGTKTWSDATGDKDITFTTSGDAGNLGFKSLTITYASGGSTTVATPTFTPAEGTYSSTQTVTISCETSGATIYYTTDGTIPTTSSTTYSAAISVSSTTTIKAIAAKSDMTTSDMASATYTISGSNPCASPMTVAAGYDAASGNPTGVCVKGIIYKIDQFGSNSITYWISDDGTSSAAKPLEVYKGKGIGGADFSAITDLHVSDIVVINGNLKVYNSTPEFDSNSQLVSLARISSIAVKTAPTTTSYDAGDNFDPTGLVITATYDNGETKDYSYASYASNFSFSPSTSTALTTSNTSVTITYGGKSTTQSITVTSGGGGSCGIFSETWASTSGTGGNDGSWSGSIAQNTIYADKSGWSYTYGGGAKECVKLGNSSNSGVATTPSISVTSGVTYSLSFKAGAWGTDGTGLTLSATGATLDETDFTMKQSEWDNFSTTLVATSSSMTITFTGAKRFFLDEVCISEATTYTITAHSNNVSYGTVSVSGNIITATPASGYVPDGYTLNSGTVSSVTQSGNTYTVVATSDCDITINFRAATSYTITLIDNNTSWTETAYEGTPYTLPDEYKSTCPDATFLGWANGEYTNHYTGTSTNPGYTAGGEEVNITEPTTFVAVYGTIDGEPTDDYVEITQLSDLTTGDYLFATANSGLTTAYPMTNTITDNHMGEVTLSVSSKKITTTNSAIIWHVTKSGSNYTIYNSAVGKYLALSTSSPLLQNEAHNYTVVYDDQWIFESTTVSGYQLSAGTNTEYFESATSQTYIIHLFKRQVAMAYTSHPNCCHEPATPLAISAEPTTLIGSGVTTIALEGGNNQNITWSTTGGTLSNQSNTGATLTLSSAGTYTVTATQPDDETDPDNVICGATVTTNITVKAQWTITLKTKDDGSANTYDTKTVTDGDTYTLPDLSEDYTCDEGYSFAGWATSESATAVEKTAGSVITASSTTTWWAVWKQSGSSSTETRTRYSLVTNASSLSANDVFVLTYNNFAHGQITSGDYSPNATCVNGSDAKGAFVTFASTETPQLFTLEGTNDAWKLYTGSQYVQFESKKYALVDAVADATACTIAIASDKATISDGSYAIRYNTTSPRWYSTSSTSLQLPKMYKQDGTVTIDVDASVSYTVNNTGCENGAIIRADGNQWITAANGQKVKTIIPVIVKNFETAATLTVTSSNPDFTASLETTSVPVAPAQLNTNLIVEYQPNYSNNSDNTTITLTAGEVTKNITVNGRSLPDEFLMIAKKTLWYAVPANMNDGAGAYNGVNVVPNDGTEPDKVAVAPSTVIYSLKSVANSRYTTAGQYVRLAGLGNKGLWANGSTSTTTIYNNAPIADSNDGHYEWELATTDGIHYTISNPAHPDAAAGRQLALGGTSGLFYGLYKTATTFFLVPAGCTSQPQEVNVSARRTDATFSWVSNASSLTIDIYTDEAMTALAKSETATSSPYMMLGLNETTEYWFKLTPDGSEDCAVTGKFKTTGPVIDIVEWEENKAIIFVDKDEELHPRIVIDGEVEHGAGSGATATDIFFSKYFEAEGTAKMLGVFNGTTNDIPLTDITIVQRSLTGDAKAFSLASYGAQRTGYIKAGEEILFYTRDSREAVMECAEADPTFSNWNNVDGKEGASNFSFGGKGTIRLFRGNTCIDIIGAMVEGNDIDDNKQATVEGADSPSWAPVRDNEKGFVTAYGDNYLTKDVEESDYGLSSCRCLLIRKSFVTSGDSAVLNNFGEFKTLGVYTGVDSKQHKGEWAGLQIPDASGSEKDYIHTCEGFQEVGKFDYSKYYKEWTNVLPGEELDGNVLDAAAKTYEIEIDNLAQYSCLNLKFQLTNKDDVTEVYTEQQVQVPILVKGEHQTVDAIFNSIVKNDGGDPLYDESINRCKTCDVVVLGTGVLTKATDGTLHDAPKIGNLKVYPGGKIVVPTGTTYEINSLALRRQEDALPLADIQGTLNITQPNATYLDIRIDPSNWHYFTLPYDVNVSDITFVDGTPAAIGTDFRIGRYDGEHRAATQSQSWVNLPADDVVKAGIGYIIGLPGSGKVQRELRFPMANSVVAEEQTDKDVEGLHAWGGDKTDEELRPNHKGWNLIGAPYLSYYYTTLQEPLPTGQLIQDPGEDPWKGHWVRNSSSLRYIVVPVDNGMSEYDQVDIYNYHMAPFTSYFVQIGGADPAANQKITYNGAQAGKFNVARRAPHEYEEDNHEVWFGINLVNDKNEQDATTLLISDKFTDDYDIMDDLVKMRGAYYQYAQITTKPVLASRNSKGEMAFNALPDASAAAGVPLNFFAAQDGQYRFAVSANYPLDEIKEAYLYDNENAEAKWHNLLEEDYIFTSKRGDNTTRFLLAVKVERKQPEITTALNNTNSRLALTTIDHTLILSGLSNNADIFVYDVSGKLLNRGQYSANMNGVYRTVVDNPGLYFVRVKTDSDLQTLQTLVY